MQWILLLLVFLSAPAWAVNDWGEADGCLNGSKLGNSGVICFSFDENVADESEHTFSLQGYGLATFDGDLATQTTSTATAILFSCAPDATGPTDCAQVCNTAGCTFDSTPGVPASQLEAVLLPPGTYRLKIKTVPGAGETGLFYVRGIGQ
jgi:hypothetical protein